MASTKSVTIPWYKRLFTKPANLMTVSKAIGGNEQINVNFYFTDASELQGLTDAAYKVLDTRMDVVKKEMLKIEAEMRKATAKADKEDK